VPNQQELFLIQWEPITKDVHMKFLSIIKDQKRGCDKNPYGRSKKEIRRKIDKTNHPNTPFSNHHALKPKKKEHPQLLSSEWTSKSIPTQCTKRTEINKIFLKKWIYSVGGSDTISTRIYQSMETTKISSEFDIIGHMTMSWILYVPNILSRTFIFSWN